MDRKFNNPKGEANEAEEAPLQEIVQGEGGKVHGVEDMGSSRPSSEGTGVRKAHQGGFLDGFLSWQSAKVWVAYHLTRMLYFVRVLRKRLVLAFREAWRDSWQLEDEIPVSSVKVFHERRRRAQEADDLFLLRQALRGPRPRSGSAHRMEVVSAMLVPLLKPFDEMWEAELKAAGVKTKEEYRQKKEASQGPDELVLTDEEVQHLVPPAMRPFEYSLKEQ